MKRIAFALAGAALLVDAGAAIAPGTSGNGELFLNVVDSLAKVSYTLDLGITMDAFFVAGQQEIGSQHFWAVDSTTWTSFLDAVTLSNLRWSVVAVDSTGSNTAGNQRLFTTVRQGDETNIGNTINSNFSLGIGAAQAGSFLSQINSMPAHLPSGNYTVNADSFSRESDSGRAYYGEIGGLTPTYNGAATFNATNAVGSSSWFYYLTRSGTGNLASNRVLIDEFDNLGHDGYWGFVKVENQDSTSPFYDPTSPYAGKYLLSFTMPVFDLRTTTSFRAFAQGIGRTEYSGGLQITTLAGAAAAGATEQSAGWVTVLGAAPAATVSLVLLGGTHLSAVTAVPEPGTWWLLLAGGAALTARRSLRKPQA